MKKLYYGAAYYPELWSEAVFDEDIRAMKKLGINVVRMGEFAWSKMEPNEGDISLDFFCEIIKKLNQEGIHTIFCTPTPTPPIWITDGHPERMHVNESGVRMNHGARQHVCTNNPYFRERSRIITEAIAKAVGALDGVIAWQIDNEFKCHVAECCCDECCKQWREWLASKYGAVAALNAAWGADVWSETYQRFDQVPTPSPTPYYHNAALLTNYRMFTREKIAEFAKEQADIIRRYSSAPITHNGMRYFHVDNDLLFKNLDFASFDAYHTCEAWADLQLDCDLWRNVKQGKPFWVMETSPAHNGSILGYERPHEDGFLKAEFITAWANGAEGCSFWVWRQQRSGIEQVHGCLLSSWGQPAVGFNNAMKIKEAMEKLEPILIDSETIPAEVAMTYSDRARAFMLTEKHFGDYTALMKHWYSALLGSGIWRDLLFESRDFSHCKLLTTPYNLNLTPDFIERAKQFVEKGGIWIIGPHTHQRTSEHTVPTDTGMGGLDVWAGSELTFAYPLTGTSAVGEGFGETMPLIGWGAVYKPLESEVKGVVRGGITPDAPFITERVVGKGKAVLFGCQPNGDEGNALLSAMFKHYCNEAGVKQIFKSSPGTVVVPRLDSSGSLLLFAVNLDGKSGQVQVQGEAVNILTGTVYNNESVVVPRYSAVVLKQ